MTLSVVITACLTLVAVVALLQWKRCRHRWVQFGSGSISRPVGTFLDPTAGPWVQVGDFYDLRCEHCGAIKRVRV